jgi:hypothetical protein
MLPLMVFELGLRRIDSNRETKTVKFSDATVPEPKILKVLPQSDMGYGDIDYEFRDRDLIVDFQHFDQGTREENRGRIVFSFVIALSIESENNNHTGFPPDSGVIYGFDADLREGFTGYQVWFTHNDLVTVVCQKAIIGNEVF